MKEKIKSDYFNKYSDDPLSDISHKRRRNLLLISLFSFAVYTVGLIPQKITWAGIEFSNKDFHSLKIFIIIILVYFLIMFILSASAETFTWAFNLLYGYFQPEGSDDHEELTPSQILGLIRNEKYLLKRNKMDRLSRFLAILRVFIDFIFPIILGILALIFTIW